MARGVLSPFPGELERDVAAHRGAQYAYRARGEFVDDPAQVMREAGVIEGLAEVFRAAAVAHVQADRIESCRESGLGGSDHVWCLVASGQAMQRYNGRTLVGGQTAVQLVHFRQHGRVGIRREEPGLCRISLGVERARPVARHDGLHVTVPDQRVVRNQPVRPPQGVGGGALGRDGLRERHWKAPPATRPVPRAGG